MNEPVTFTKRRPVLFLHEWDRPFHKKSQTNGFGQGVVHYSAWVSLVLMLTAFGALKVIKFPPVTGTKARLFIPTATGNVSLWELGFYSYSMNKIANIPNTGSYSWVLPEHLPTDIQLQLRATHYYATIGALELTNRQGAK